MRRHPRRDARDADLMDDNILNIYLSKRSHDDTYEIQEKEEVRLQRFINHQEDLRNSRLYRSGEHGVTFLVSIRNIEYLLKVFKIWKQPGPKFYPYEQAVLITPLACECRAFARLNSMSMNGTWAIKCYGWMQLSDTQFKSISRVAESQELSRWAIVKEYEPLLSNVSHIPRIYANFEIAKRARILPVDIRAENYRESKIVDLSSVLTDPCPEWNEFLFKFFYKETIHGVFDWFPPASPPTVSTSFLLLTSTCTLALILGGLFVLRRLRR